MIHIIKQIIKEQLKEEFIDNSLIGYHVTSVQNLDSIKKQGFKIGQRKMQGKGFYAFYDYNHAKGYATKDIGFNGEVAIVKFVVKNPNRILYLNMDIAKQFLGNNYSLLNQIEEYFNGGFEEFYNNCLTPQYEKLSVEQIKDKLNQITENNTEGIQKTFLFDMVSMEISDNLNIVWDGNYGLEFRINNTNNLKPIGYEIITSKSFKTTSQYHDYSLMDDVPKEPEFEPLIDFLKNNQHINSFPSLYKIIQDNLYEVRNNREYDYYDNLLNLIEKLK